MTELTQKNLQASKGRLDFLIKEAQELALETQSAYVGACRADLLDMRDDLAHLAGHLNQAVGSLQHARAVGGRLQGGGVTRAGGT